MRNFCNMQPAISLLIISVLCIACNGRLTTRLSHTAVKFGSGNGATGIHSPKPQSSTRRRGSIDMRSKGTAPKIIIAGAPAAGKVRYKGGSSYLQYTDTGNRYLFVAVR